MDAREQLASEKEALGLYLSAHPLANVIKGRLPDGYSEIARLPHMAVGQTTRIIACVRSVRRFTVRGNRTMAVIEIEDLTERTEMVLYPDIYDEFGTDLNDDDIVEVVGKVDRRNDQFQIVGERISKDVTPIEAEPPSRLVRIVLSPSDDYWRDVEVLQRLDAILAEHDGHDRVEFEVCLGDRKVRIASGKHRVEWDDQLAEQVRETLLNATIQVEPELVA